MNAVEIEEAVSALAEADFDAEEFPYQFLAAFGNKETTLKRLRQGTSNKSDVPGGVLQRSNIHLAVCEPGEVSATLKALIESPATAKQKAKFALATDGQTIEAANLVDEAEPPLVCEYRQLSDSFGYLLPLAGITTVRQIKENAFDIKATGRLNRLYVELLRNNPDWDAADRREALNHFFARLIFCFFAEDTGIFIGTNLFTATIQQMSEPDGSNTHEVLSELFRAMDTAHATRDGANLRSWTTSFPYVNGGLFSGAGGGDDVPKFSKIARSYLLHIGGLDWTKINPDIFGSMIQAVADDEERGALGMHYTSVPNILKVLNPLFLDDLRAQLEEAGDGFDQGSKRKLLNLRNRIARIRVFDPACGSGNFLVITYKEMREIEHQCNRRRGEYDRATDIPLTNFRGIEIRHFACEVARLALIIAEYQCDAKYRGDRLALAEFLPLNSENWITHGNALRLDWLSVCPPTGTDTEVQGDDLFEKAGTPDIDFQNEGGETYICGNPPYSGSREQGKEQKDDLQHLLDGRTPKWKALDYVAGWFVKAASYTRKTNARVALVTTNSVCQGQQVPLLWPILFSLGVEVYFAHTSFKWANLASHNAGVTVVIVGLAQDAGAMRAIYSVEEDGTTTIKTVPNINAYLAPSDNTALKPVGSPLSGLPEMTKGNYPVDGGHLLLSHDEKNMLGLTPTQEKMFVRPFRGSSEIIKGTQRYCIWITNLSRAEAESIPRLAYRIDAVRQMRLASKKIATQRAAATSHKFDEIRQTGEEEYAIALPVHSSENREFLPSDVLAKGTIVYGSAFAMFEAPLYCFSLIVSRLHLVWIATVCGKLETRYRYSNTLGWNTFPVPPLSDQNEYDLTRCAEDILLAREAHWPATIADMYDPDRMDTEFPDLRAAHDRNDETLERIYIGRRFKNDTERLEKLFEMYTAMTAKEKGANAKTRKGAKK